MATGYKSDEYRQSRRDRYQRLYHDETNPFKSKERERYKRWYQAHKESINAKRRELRLQQQQQRAAAKGT